VSLAVFALVVVIWVVLLVPLARRGRAELAAEASEGGRRLTSGGARPWTSGNLPATDEPTDEELEVAALAARLARRRADARPPATRRRRVLLALVLATAAGLRAWAMGGGRWWLAAAATGALLAGYLVTLVGLGWRRARRRRALAAGARRAPGRRGRWATPAPWGGQVPVSSE
jgi:membrane protein YdbS with pleckstrin-like domain